MPPFLEERSVNKDESHTPGDEKPVLKALAYMIANDLERSISDLGYPVGMGLAPRPEVCQAAAQRIVDKIKDKALALLAERQSPSLIAAAPALVEALKNLCDEIAATEEHGDGAYDADCPICNAHEAARTALRQALGEEK